MYSFLGNLLTKIIGPRRLYQQLIRNVRGLRIAMKIPKISFMVVAVYLSLTVLPVFGDGWYERKGLYGDDDFYEHGRFNSGFYNNPASAGYGSYGYRGYKFDDDWFPFFSYQPSMVSPLTPQIFIQQQEQPIKQQMAYYWYYCRKTDTYYPYVQSCPGGWMQVVPHSPSP